ncbi:MAG: trigger factor [Caldilineales bacterium]|nr:trigger factor [Caldilineales bacterium]MCW5860065.1 trigger factor [Caldilineales bacterium]
MTDLIITQQALDNRQMSLTVTVPNDRTELALRDAARRLGKNYRFPGFRPGKAPYHVIAQRVGRAALIEEAMSEIGSDLFEEALATTGLEPYAPGHLTDLTLDPLTLTFAVPLAPIADPGDYRSLRLDIPPLDEAEVEEHIQADLSQMGRGQTLWAPVDRPIQYGDLATINLKLTVEDEVVLEQEDWDFSPSETDYTLLPAFDAAFIGMSSGESKSFSASFPAESDSAWAGKEGQFEITVTAIKSKGEPAYDDAFAIAHGFENAAVMFQKLRDHATAHVQAEADDAYRRRAIETLLEEAELHYPPAAIDNMVNLLVAEQESVFRGYGFESTAEVLRLQKRSEEDYLEELRPQAERRLRHELLLNAIAEREQFPVSDYELDNLLVENLERDADELAKMRHEVATNLNYRLWLTGRIQRHKAVDLVVAIARGEDVPAPGQHLAEEAPPVEEEEPEVMADDESEPEAEIEAASQPAGETDATVDPSPEA